MLLTIIFTGAPAPGAPVVPTPLVLTVVPLLFELAQVLLHLPDDSASKAAKTVVRQKIVSVSAEGYVSQQSSTPEKPKGRFLS